METLAPVPGSLHIDATLGGGGHARQILEATSPDGRLLGLDADRAAIARTRERLAGYGKRVTLRQANFEELASVAGDEGFAPADRPRPVSKRMSSGPSARKLKPRSTSASW